MPMCLRPAPEFFDLAAGMSRAQAEQYTPAAPPPFAPGDRVTEPKWPDVVLTVKSCDARGYTRAERYDTLPDGRKLFAFSTSGPAKDFVLFARAGDERPEPAPKPVRMSAVGRLEAMYDGHISKEQYAAARREDAAAALEAEYARSFAQQAAE